MRRATWLVLAAAAVVATGVIVWRVHAPPAPPMATQPPANVSIAKPPTSPGISFPGTKAPKRAAPATAAHGPLDPRVPVDEAVSQLREWADAGDVDAQIELTRRLMSCTPHAQRVAHASDERDRQYLEYDAADRSLGDGLRGVRRETTQYRLDDTAARRAACSRLPADLKANWLEFVDRAAQSGNTTAMREYAFQAMLDYDGVASIAVGVDTAIVRRDRARAYLASAVSAGDVDALIDLARAYGDNGDVLPAMYAMDHAKAYAFAYAASLAALNAYQQAENERTLSEHAAALDARSLAAAQADGKEIYERCCEGVSVRALPQS